MGPAILHLAALFFVDECSPTLHRAQVAYDARQFEAAAAEFEKALESCSASSAILHSLAQSQLMLGHFDDTVATLNRLLAIEPRNVDAMKLRGDALYLLGKDQEAEESLTAALRIQPDHRNALYALGRIYYQQHRYVESAKQFERIISQDARDYRAHDNLALAYEALNEDKKAVLHYLKALDLVYKDHPEYDWAYSNFANFMLRRGEYDKAFQLALEASKRNPNSSRNLFLTGKALQKLGKLEQSVRWLQQSIKVDPTYPEPRYVLAQVYRKLGLADKATGELTLFRELSKNPRSRR